MGWGEDGVQGLTLLCSHAQASLLKWLPPSESAAKTWLCTTSLPLTARAMRTGVGLQLLRWLLDS